MDEGLSSFGSIFCRGGASLIYPFLKSWLRAIRQNPNCDHPDGGSVVDAPPIAASCATLGGLAALRKRLERRANQHIAAGTRRLAVAERFKAIETLGVE